MSTQNRLSADVIIAGGGMIGLSMATALAAGGFEVLVVDANRPADLLVPEFDGRVTSLTWGVHAMYRTLGVWEDMGRSASAIQEIRVSDDRAPFFLHFDHRDVGDRPFGFMVENRHIRHALQAAAERHPDIHLIAPASVVSTELDRGRRQVVLDDGRELSAPLLIAAEGRHSRLREQAGIRCLAWRYPQDAIVCTARHPNDHENVACEHFLPGGPFALLPMQSTRSAIVWSDRTAAVDAAMALDRPRFDAALNERAGDSLGWLQHEAHRWRFPLGLQNAERYIDERLVLVGDAAHAMHPIAGQGLNLGLRDVACLAELLVDAARLGQDIGDAGLLTRYQRWRRFDALSMLVMTDGLTRLFSNANPMLRRLRGLGLGLVNGLPPAKRFFERRAAAMAGDLPRLVRGEAL